ncbi:aldo/keto reductase [Thalassotalea sp. PLHSN55]|uniref:aldo/keto reductase n=1 Tax=Thalassotalea sp. PLHSN55 TaxID=3435888 RepID=UPI003F87A2E6
MQHLDLANTGLKSSRLIYGCMRISGDNSLEDRVNGKHAIHAAIDAGYNHFDHADIYGGGHSEALFGEVIKESPQLRDKLIVTSKAGVRFANQPNAGDPARYDNSREHLIKSAEGSLSRLNVDALDLFLVHRPDFLMDVNEIAEAFALLKASGKVKHFGVSNFSPAQVSLLQSALPMPVVVNQVEMNIHNTNAFTDGTLSQCQMHNIMPVAWCPLGGVAYSAWGNTFSSTDELRIEAELLSQSEKYQAEPWQVILAWLCLHPANICPIIGSTMPARIEAATAALAIHYQKEDWYRLFEARNGESVP